MNERKLTIGIQGGIGSFNDEAVRFNIEKNNITDVEIQYLYTTIRVLAEIEQGTIDRGQFAIHNFTGGVVWESLSAMGKYPFTPIEEFSIPIAHALIVRKDVRFEDVDTIMTHPQVLAQCRNNLNHKYPHLKQISGDGDLIDHSNVAKHLAEGKLSKTIATMGSKVLAEIYNLKVVEEGLQDLSENCTTFLWVSR